MKMILNNENRKMAGEEKAFSKLGACARDSKRIPKNKKQQQVTIDTRKPIFKKTSPNNIM